MRDQEEGAEETDETDEKEGADENKEDEDGEDEEEGEGEGEENDTASSASSSSSGGPSTSTSSSSSSSSSSSFSSLSAQAGAGLVVDEGPLPVVFRVGVLTVHRLGKVRRGGWVGMAPALPCPALAWVGQREGEGEGEGEGGEIRRVRADRPACMSNNESTYFDVFDTDSLEPTLI